MGARDQILFRPFVGQKVTLATWRRAAQVAGLAFGFSLLGSSETFACDLAKALFENWPDARPLISPIEFTASNGMVLTVTQAAVERYSDTGKCVASFRVEVKDEEKEYLHRLGGRYLMKLYDIAKSASEELLIDSLKKDCRLERMEICYLLNNNPGCRPNYIYFRDDGTFYRRYFEICSP